MNVTCLADTGGDAVERYVYDPYGKVTILNGANGVDKDGAVTEWTEDGDQTASDVDNAILYCGYYHDWETGLYHVRNRMYHPNLGCWLQRDPLGYVDGMSLYEYCSGRPVFGVDPTGCGFFGNLWETVKSVADTMAQGAYTVAECLLGINKIQAGVDARTLELQHLAEQGVRYDPNTDGPVAQLKAAAGLRLNQEEREALEKYQKEQANYPEKK